MSTLRLRRPAPVLPTALRPAAARPVPVTAAAPVTGGKRPAAIGIAEDLQKVLGPNHRLADVAPVLDYTSRRGGLEFLPLQIGFLQVLCARINADDEQRRRIAASLARWTSCNTYLRALSADGAMRFDIDGRPVEPVASDHMLAAAVRLAGMDALHAKVKEAAKRNAA